MAVSVTGGDLNFVASLDVAGFEAQLKRLEAGIMRNTQLAEREATAIESFAKKTVSAIAGYATLGFVSNLVRDVVTIRGEFQKLETAFTTMLGSREKADALLKQVTEFSAKTPWSLQEVATATKQLLAFGFSAETVIDDLRRIGDISAGIGAPVGDIAYLLGTIRTQGVAMTVDIRQFASRGIPIYEELAKVLKVNTDEVQKLITAGKVGFPEVEQAFRNLTSEGGKFFDLTAQQAKTLSGQISNLGDAWDRMLNDIGKSNQGTFSNIIGTATSLVDNYQKVLDILTLVGITYGSYRAALILTTVAERLQERAMLQNALAGNVLTASQGRQAAALVVLQGAWRSLYATMVSFAPVAVIAALSTAVYALTQTTNAAAQSEKNLANAHAEGAKAAAQEREKIAELNEVLQSTTSTREQQVTALTKIRDLTGDYLKGFTDEQILAGQAKVALDAYTESIYKNAVAKSARNTIADLTNQMAELEVKGTEALGTFEKLAESMKGAFGFGDYDKVSFAEQFFSSDKADAAIIANKKAGLKKQIEDLKNTFKTELTNDLLGTGAPSVNTAATKRSVAVIDELITKLKEEQKAVSENSRQWNDYQKRIAELEAEKQRITGATKSELKAQETLENRINALLQQRTDILRTIEGLRNDARISGMLKEESAIVRVNAKYDDAIFKINDFNKRVAAANKRNGTNIQGIGLNDINALNAARTQELRNVNFREEAERYTKSLEEQKSVFQRYEEAKKQIGIEKANELYAAQTKGFTSHLEHLNAEAKKLAPKIVLGIANIGEVLKAQAITKQINAATKESADQQRQAYIQLLIATETYDNKRKAIESRYYKDVQTLEKRRTTFTAAEYAERLKHLTDAKDAENKALDADLVRSSDLFKRLNQDTITFSRAQLKTEIKELQQLLSQKLFKNAAGEMAELPPQLRKQIEDYIEQLKSLDKSLTFSGDNAKLAKDMNAVAGYARLAEDSFRQMADAVRDINSDLADTLDNTAALASIASDAAGSLASAASGDIGGAIKGLMSVWMKELDFFVLAPKRTREAAQKEMDAFNAQVQAAELEINAILRERAREQERINELRIQGIEAETKLLQEQQKAVASQSDALLKQLQQQSYVSAVETERYGGFLGIGRKTRTKEVLESLASKSYEEIERLFMEGRLTEEAAKLFEQLRKLKDEGEDINAALQEVARAQNELFTGTTADNLASGILEGLKQGKRGFRDFAGDFEEQMRASFDSIFEAQAIQARMQEFYKQFAEAAKSGGGVDAAEYAALKKAYETYVNDISKEYAAMGELFGVNKPAGTQDTAVQGAVSRAITEDTANQVLGRLGGIQMSAAQILELATQNLKLQQQIERNTFLTASRVAESNDLLRRFDTQGIKIR